MLATVTRFDEFRGDGVVTNDDGEEIYFHCVAIANGSRSINVGARVSIELQVGHLGRDEALSVQPLLV